MFRPAYLALIVLILIPCISHAKTETIFADHKYVMGDNDSKNDARRMCFLEAKRKVLEKAGTYIESHTQVKNYQLTKDEINSYASALLKVETVKEEWKFVGENMAVFLTVKAEVDTGHIEKQLAKIKKDVSVQKKIKDQQGQIRELERKYIELQSKLEKVSSSRAFPLRKEREDVLQDIDDINASVLKTANIQDGPRTASVKLAKRILTYVQMEMTVEQVKTILGKADKAAWISIDRPFDVDPEWMCSSYTCYQMFYNKFAINFSKRKRIVESISIFDPSSKKHIKLKTYNYNILKHFTPYRNDPWVVKKYVFGE